MYRETSDGCMEATRSRSRTSSSESSRAPIRACSARVLLWFEADESVAWWIGLGNWAANTSNGSEDSKEEDMESMRPLPLAFTGFSSEGESGLARLFSWEPKKGLCILLFGWVDGSTISADWPSYWTTSADSHLCDWRTVASGVGMAILRLEDKGSPRLLEEEEKVLGWALVGLTTSD